MSELSLPYVALAHVLPCLTGFRSLFYRKRAAPTETTGTPRLEHSKATSTVAYGGECRNLTTRGKRSRYRRNPQQGWAEVGWEVGAEAGSSVGDAPVTVQTLIGEKRGSSAAIAILELKHY